MLLLISIVALALAGILGANALGGLHFEALPELPTAASVIGILLILYLATLLNHRGERRLALWPTLAACISGAVLVAGAYNKTGPIGLADLLAVAKPADEDVALAHDASASVRLRRRDDGGFFANSEINGAPMTVQIDNGAATVILRSTDAEKAGIDIDRLSYDTPLKTANGVSYLAPVRLKSVRIGPLVMTDVEGMVARAGTLNENLLGTSFLRRLSSYVVAGNFATLRQ